MQRQIKFRGWALEKRLMYFDVYFLKTDTVTMQGREYFFKTNTSIIPDLQYIGNKSHNSCILMQYICRTDKQNNELYEGDIILLGGKTKSFIWNDKHRYTIGTEEKPIEPFHLSECKKVGNIFENPELVPDSWRMYFFGLLG